jgi:aminoglycoside phosphotransferase (APT) family kinase protein
VNAAAEPLPPAAALALVPGLEAGAAPLRLERLSGGSVNDSWRVDSLQGRFVLRIDGPLAQRPGVERARERRIHELAAHAGLAPAALVWADAVGTQVREFLEGRVWQEHDMLQPDQLQRLGERLAQLHAIEPPGELARFDPGACAQQYLQLIDTATAAAPNMNARRVANAAATAATAAAAAVRAAAARVAGHDVRPAIVHGDLAHSNVLDGRRLWLLDWEYAQCADPVYDVACLLAYYPAARQQAPQLLAAAGLSGPSARGRLADAILVYEGLTWLWHLARGTGVDAD